MSIEHLSKIFQDYIFLFQRWRDLAVEFFALGLAPPLPPRDRRREVYIELIHDILVHVQIVVLLVNVVEVVVILIIVIVIEIVGNICHWKICCIHNSVFPVNIHLPTENIDTDMERKAICERDTAAESAREGQDSPPPPPSRDTYITPFLLARLFLLTRVDNLRDSMCLRMSALVVFLSSKYKSSHDLTSNFEWLIKGFAFLYSAVKISLFSPSIEFSNWCSDAANKHWWL